MAFQSAATNLLRSLRNSKVLQSVTFSMSRISICNLFFAREWWKSIMFSPNHAQHMAKHRNAISCCCKRAMCLEALTTFGTSQHWQHWLSPTSPKEKRMKWWGAPFGAIYTAHAYELQAILWAGHAQAKARRMKMTPQCDFWVFLVLKEIALWTQSVTMTHTNSNLQKTINLEHVSSWLPKRWMLHSKKHSYSYGTYSPSLPKVFHPILDLQTRSWPSWQVMNALFCSNSAQGRPSLKSIGLHFACAR